MRSDEQARLAERAIGVIGDIAPAFRDQGAEVSGMVIAELLAQWLAGHPNFSREKLLQVQLEYVRRRIAVHEALLFKGGEHPQNTRA
jgi:hypothetical protein